MCAKFDAETFKIKEGQIVTDVLINILKEKGLADRAESATGLFFIDNVIIKSINGDEVLIEVEYEYGE